MTVFYNHTDFAQGRQTKWFEIDDVTYGVTNNAGIVDRHGLPMEYLDAKIAYELMMSAMKV